MTIAHTLGALGVMTASLLAAQAAQAQDNTFINPDWANSAWYTTLLNGRVLTAAAVTLRNNQITK